ncbi:MAG: DUF4139 domain-containing protein, partial [Bacteroidia bacterium]|nr:DUF4139 domain-containing protein [Bacteroidia bacterium]
TISSDVSATVKFELRYISDGCGWAPFYDINITDISTPLSLMYQAKLFNGTGKNWDDIDLTISTAEPGKSAQYPTLSKWIIGQSQNPSLKFKGSRSDKSESAYGVKSSSGKIAGTAQAETVISASELSIDFAISEKKTIPADARPYLVEINTFAITPTYRYIAIPKLDLQAYLTCGIVDYEQYNLMEGPANIYYDKTFIGRSYIAPQLSSDTLEISLGRDRKVALKYEKKKELSRKSFLGNSTIQSFTYEITIRNTNTKDISIDLFDQVPISENSEVAVDVNNISNAALNKDDGSLQWQVNLKAGETTKYSVSYTVKYPKGKKVQIIQFRPLRCPNF